MMRRFLAWTAWFVILFAGGVAGLRLAAPCAPALAHLDGLNLGLPSAAAACAASHAAKAGPGAPLPPAVTVATVAAEDFVENIFVSGTLVARGEALVGVQIDSLRIVEILAEDGDSVAKGQVLARLDRSQLDALLGQSDAALVRADAAIAQATSQIGQFEAIVAQTSADLDRAEKLASGVLTQTVLDQRAAAARSARAQLAAARDALNVAKAERASRVAERRELQVRIDRTEVKSPVAGVVSRRSARIGAMAMGIGDPLFRIIENGAVDLEAELPQQFIARLALGMEARLRLAGESADVSAVVRLISQEVDKASRTGKVRLALPPEAKGRIGSFASGAIVVVKRNGLAAPASAVIRTGGEAFVQAVRDEKVELRKVAPGILQGDRIELREGVATGDILVARAAAFLRAGDLIRPILPQGELIQAKKDAAP